MIMKKAIVTGATSFLGAALVRELLEAEYECYAIVREENRGKTILPFQHPSLHIICESLFNIDSLRSLLPQCDLFYHFAWGGIGAQGRANADIQAMNIEMTKQCIRLACKIGVKRFLFAGSQAEYGPSNTIIRETNECHPVTEYGKAKLKVLQLGTALAKSLPIEYVHLRIFSVYGPGDHPWTVISKCIDAFSAGRAVPLTSCEQMWNFLHVLYAAVMLRRIGEAALNLKHPIFNIASHETRKLRDFIQIIWQQSQCHGIPQYGALETTLEKPYGIQPNIERVLHAIQWHPQVLFEDGVAELITLEKAKQCRARK